MLLGELSKVLSGGNPGFKLLTQDSILDQDMTTMALAIKTLEKMEETIILRGSTHQCNANPVRLSRFSSLNT